MGIPAYSRNKSGTIQDWGFAALIKHNGTDHPVRPRFDVQ